MRPDKEQLIHTLWGGKGTHIPLMELGIHPKIKAQYLGRPVNTLADDVDFWHSAGYDYIKLQPRADFRVPLHNSDESVTSEVSWAAEGKGTISNRDDFEQFDFLTAEEIDYSNFDRVSRYLPPGMGVIGQYGDIFTMTWELMGFEGFSLALYDDPELIKAIFTRIGEPVLEMFRYFARHEAVDALWYSDDIAYIAGLMMSPEVLREYLFPWINQIGDLAAAANKPLIYHSDGALWDVIDDLIACGINALHPIEPKAMDIVEVKKRYGDKLALIGNVDVGDILAMGTPEDVRKAVIYNIEHVGHNGGYCAGSGNSIPDYVKFENYLALLNVVKDY